MDNKKLLTNEEVWEVVQEKTKIYQDKTFLESFGIYFGKCQILEWGLKQVLNQYYDVDLKSLKKYTMGRLKDKMVDEKIREDFTGLLKEVVNKRNFMAHDFLFENAQTNALLNDLNINERFNSFDRYLSKAAIELEYALVVFDWICDNKGWK